MYTLIERLELLFAILGLPMKIRSVSFIIYGLLNFFLANDSIANEDAREVKRSTNSAGIGLAGIADWSTQYPFLDQMKMSREWQADRKTNSVEGMTLDRNGWVKTIDSGITPSVVFLTGNEGLPIIYKHYVVRWKGKGRLKYDWCARKVGEKNGGDRIQVFCRDSSLLTVLESDRKDPIRNITIVPEEHLVLFDNGGVFNPDFIDKVKNFRALRFMDWMRTNGSEQLLWEGRPVPEDRTYAKLGVPIELMTKLSNKLLADPWFNIPHQADHKYIKQFAELTKQTLDPQLTVYIEHSNEVWNWVFPQTKYAFDKGKEKFNLKEGGDAFLQWHGLRTAQTCEIWKGDVFGSDSNRVICVLGVQASWPGAEAASLDCPLWAKLGNPSCIDSGIDALAITGYFSGCLNGGENKTHQRIIIGWSRLKEKGLLKAYEQVLDGRHFACEDSLKDVKKYYEYFAKETKRRGLKLLAYEGGQHITSNLGGTQNDKRFSDFHIQLNRADYMKSLYEDNFNNWIASGGGLFMHFVDSAAFTKYGSWGALEYITQESSPKWDALMKFNSTPCWWQECEK